MITEKDFYGELGRVPELPPGLFEKIDGRIRRRRTFIRTAFALAATVIIAVGTTGVWVAQRERDRSFSPEIAAELQSIKSYFAGEDIEGVTASLVLYEGEGTE
jgi:hypothetical protein